MLKLPERVRKMQADLKAALDALQKTDQEYADKPMPQNVGEKYHEDAKAAAELQDQLDKEIESIETRRRIEDGQKRIPDPVLPENGKRSGAEQEEDAGPVAGYMTLGDYIVTSPEFRKFSEHGFPKGGHAEIAVKGSLLGKFSGRVIDADGLALVPLNVEERKQRTKTLADIHEQKTVPVIGAGIIEPQRVARIPQVTADDEIRMRDVLDVQPTSSNAIEYVREESYTRAAAETAHGEIKPEAAVTYSLQTETVRTIAVHMPVQNQQLDDWPALRGLIDGRLLYDVAKREEEQTLYGDGTAPNLEGILTVPGTTDISGLARFAGGQSLIDTVRMGVTEVRTSGYRANAVVIHPIDWEEIILEKGTDNHYIWVVVTDENGSRLWGIRVVEAEAAEENAGNTTEERNLIVGDFARGSTLYDRMQANVMVGLIDDQFIRNMRTILAEERVALVHYAPAAYAFFQTQAPVS